MLPRLSEQAARERIAKNIALDLKDGSLVNLGIGIPQLVADYIPKDVKIIIQTENGIIMAGPAKGGDDYHVIDAGGRPISILPGGSIVGADLSFAMMRGGHVDATVLGVLEVDGEGSLANWMVPGVRVPGMGGAMDLVTGARRVYAATRHFNKDGSNKLVKKCTFPLTGYKVVDVIVTEYCVIKNIGGVMTLTQVAEDADLNELLEKTEMELAVAEDIRMMK
ncbi:MAG: 3-oxoacid CoA-transferase subunit B [Synergistaceae bacterium]|nr:3-oxoacid CoA-transferase subunit B [Synergistaceae bacterium]